MRRVSQALHILWSALALLGHIVGCTESESTPHEQRPRSRWGRASLADALARIGITAAPVRAQSIRPTVNVAGWLLVKPGYEVTVRATVTGLIIPDTTTSPVELGTVVTADQPLGTLRILVSPQDEAQLVVLKEEADTLCGNRWHRWKQPSRTTTIVQTLPSPDHWRAKRHICQGSAWSARAGGVRGSSTGVSLPAGRAV